jgi:hypothetical protein
MAQKASSKPESSNSTAATGFEAQTGGHSNGARQPAKRNMQAIPGDSHQFYILSFVVRCVVEMFALHRSHVYYHASELSIDGVAKSNENRFFCPLNVALRSIEGEITPIGRITEYCDAPNVATNHFDSVLANFTRAIKS